MSELATALYDEEVLHSDEVGPVIRRPLFILSTRCQATAQVGAKKAAPFRGAAKDQY